MPKFTQLIQKSLNGFRVSVYEVNLGDEKEISKLEKYIKGKIRSMKLHKSRSYSDLLTVPILNREFVDKLNKQVQKVCAPVDAKIVCFDVKRSRVTEFMSQCLLERVFNCLFYEEADKRINLEPPSADKHVPGIDVTGIQDEDGGFRFVVCEVKASKSKIPSTESKRLLADIRKDYDDEKRLAREILYYFEKLKNIEDEGYLSNILTFLIGLINNNSSRTEVLNNVILFPFLIRNNEDIVKNKNLDDFRNFKQEDFEHSTLKGVIWSFNTDIDDFCIRIYHEALQDAGK